MMPRRTIFSSESVAEGHPDKVCDTISDQILDACLAQDPKSRVACETLVKGNLVVIAGEITTNARFDYLDEVRSAIREIGYVYENSQFHADTCVIVQALSAQSRDIAQGVDAKAAEGKETAEQGAGDQGLMFGFAVRETPELMPAPIQLSHRLGRELTRLRKSGELPWLRPDAKTQVSIEYEGYRPVRVDTVVISTQHTADVKHKEIRETLIERVIKGVIPQAWIDSSTRYLINPTGRFVIGGPEGDSGLTGRKIIVDTYGGMGRHGGGAFSGKDPSKVDRSAAYMGRYVAKNVVAAGLADRCEVQFAYAIGYPDPVSISVDTFETSTVGEEKIEQAVREVFNFKPAAIIQQLELLRPIYRKTTNYGHFGREDDLEALRWERTDKADALRQYVA
ncbi:MAG: methionine adenosyltransferase [Verrucomicrobia bacterium]|nr:methionine adenosyltransferase [Verrucomicrobiota bacterium]MBV8376660.1 methionine adenosyltransferase [Verrucomicrobiota bacterium]